MKKENEKRAGEAPKERDPKGRAAEGGEATRESRSSTVGSGRDDPRSDDRRRNNIGNSQTVVRMAAPHLTSRFFVDRKNHGQPDEAWIVFDRSLILPNGSVPKEARVWEGTSVAAAMSTCAKLNRLYVSATYGKVQ